MKIIFSLLFISLFAGSVQGQIADASQNGNTIYIKKDNGRTSTISTCKSCVLAGSTSQFVVVVWSSEYCANCKEVVIYNSDGDRYGSFKICKECVVKSVLNNKIVHTDGLSRTSAHDFKGNIVNN